MLNHYTNSCLTPKQAQAFVADHEIPLSPLQRLFRPSPRRWAWDHSHECQPCNDRIYEAFVQRIVRDKKAEPAGEMHLVVSRKGISTVQHIQATKPEYAPPMPPLVNGHLTLGWLAWFVTRPYANRCPATELTRHLYECSNCQWAAYVMRQNILIEPQCGLMPSMRWLDLCQPSRSLVAKDVPALFRKLYPQTRNPAT